uniref:Ig-like domain-containing protein n=1 Tax=Oryzias latipes TaxID=8090 RepID=A0A3P9H6M5_ORYLA
SRRSALALLALRLSLLLRPSRGGLVKPSISMDPVGEVSWGQELRITCSTAAELLEKTFILQKISGSFRETQISASRAATFNISKVNLDHDGLYLCNYEKTVSGQTFISPLSDLLNVTGKKNFRAYFSLHTFNPCAIQGTLTLGFGSFRPARPPVGNPKCRKSQIGRKNKQQICLGQQYIKCPI